MILLDTSVLIDAFTGPRRSARVLRAAIARRERIFVPTVVLYEWLRGPRRTEEVAAQQALFPPRAAIPFGSEEAALAAELYRVVPRPRGREIDLAIAACAVVRGATLWTFNVRDFKDVPQLEVSVPQ